MPQIIACTDDIHMLGPMTLYINRLPDDPSREQQVVILREATRQEYEEFCRAEEVEVGPPPPGFRYYAMLVD